MQIVFTKKGKVTFEAIKEQIIDRWGENAALKFESRTVKALNTIAKSPYIYQSLAYTTEIRKAQIHKNCSVLYEVKEAEIIILFFWDNRQEPLF